MNFYLSTLADVCVSENDGKISYQKQDTAILASKYGMGIEISEFCLSENLDNNFTETDENIRKKLEKTDDVILHAPYNELSPCSIDPLALQLTKLRYSQAHDAVIRYNAKKMVVHSGYNPLVYFREWFVDRSVIFWKQFLLENTGDYIVCLENVMEDEPSILLDVVCGVDDERLKLCLDIGHANLSQVMPIIWLKRYSDKISHMHIHNNFGKPGEGAKSDTHGAPDEGNMDIEEILRAAKTLCPDISVTIESVKTDRYVKWLSERRYISAISEED